MSADFFDRRCVFCPEKRTSYGYLPAFFTEASLYRGEVLVVQADTDVAFKPQGVETGKMRNFGAMRDKRGMTLRSRVKIMPGIFFSHFKRALGFVFFCLLLNCVPQCLKP